MTNASAKKGWARRDAQMDEALTIMAQQKNMPG